MKSKITIDVNWANEPVIKIQFVESEDLRDKMVKRYLERLGNRSEWCEITFEPDREGIDKTAIISTIAPNDITRHLDWMRQVSDQHQSMVHQSMVPESTPMSESEKLMINIIEKLQSAGMQDAVDIIYPKIVDVGQPNNHSIVPNP